MKRAFTFTPEMFELRLFEKRTIALATLEAAGIQCFKHFDSLDVDDDNSRLEVCGIRSSTLATDVCRVLLRIFPTWIYGVDEKNWGLHPGWRVTLQPD